MSAVEVVAQQLAPGVTTDVLHDGQIVRYNITTVHQEFIDKWIEHLDRVMMTWDHVHPRLLLLEMHGTPLTPYIRKVTQDIAKKHGRVSGRTAIVVKKTLVTQVIRFFVERVLARPGHQLRERRLFFFSTEALAWLEEAIKK